MKTGIEIVPYGGISSKFTKGRRRIMTRRARVSKCSARTRQLHRCVFVSFSQDLDERFVEMFLKRAAHDTRLLIVNKGASSDTLLTRVVRMQIRSPERFYVADCVGTGKARSMTVVWSLLRRLASTVETADSQARIFDAKVEGGVLHVISPDFNRLDVPIALVPQFKSVDASRINRFEIDEDGSFIYWPELDLHLGWTQLQQLVNPEAALKASQKNQDFNTRYGKAVQKVRQQAGLKPGAISGISEKQLRRIENGECRLTGNAIQALSQAHKLTPNKYMTKLAEALD